MGKKDKFDFSATNLLAYVMKRIKVLILISLAAAIITAIFALFIPNRFKSEVFLFPISQTSFSRSLGDTYYSKGKGELLAVGEDEELDQLQQMVNSPELGGMLINKFNLMQHYKIDPNSKNASKKLGDRLGSNLKFSRTEYGSINVQVWDEDPKMAADMANFIPIIIDSFYHTMEKERITVAYNELKIEFDSLSAHVVDLRDSLKKINKTGVYNIIAQSTQMTRAYYKALMKNRNDIARQVKKDMEKFGENCSRLQVISEELEQVQDKQAQLAAKLTVAHIALKDKSPRKFIVNKAYPADYKDSPKRSLIVIVAAIIAFFTTLMAFIIVENIKKLK